MTPVVKAATETCNFKVQLPVCAGLNLNQGSSRPTLKMVSLALGEGENKMHVAFPAPLIIILKNTLVSEQEWSQYLINRL